MAMKMNVLGILRREKILSMLFIIVNKYTMIILSNVVLCYSQCNVITDFELPETNEMYLIFIYLF